MKKYVQKIATILSAFALALIAFPSGVYADIAPEPPLPTSNGSGSVAGIVIVVLVIVVAAASIIILKEIKNK